MPLATSISKYQQSVSPLHAADLAVDWIADKLYVTESDAQKIQEYDLHTEQMREVVTTGAQSRPVSIAVYPYPGQGWAICFQKSS